MGEKVSEVSLITLHKKWRRDTRPQQLQKKFGFLDDQMVYVPRALDRQLLEK